MRKHDRMIFLRKVPEDLHRRIRLGAAERGVSVPKFVLQVMDEYTRRKRRKGGK